MQAHSDLSSYQRLNSTYIDQTVISGLLARMYLLKEDWTNAAKYAKEARASYGAPAIRLN